MPETGAFQPSLAVYEQWIAQQSSVAHKRWSGQLNSPTSAQREGAIAEAVVFDYLASREIEMALADRPGSGGPDFRCTTGNKAFFVEVTNIAESTAESRTSLVDGKKGAQFYAPLTRAILNKVLDKASSFKDFDQSIPLAIFVTTLQFKSSAVCVSKHHLGHLLTGVPHISMQFDEQKAEAVGIPQQRSRLKDSLFLRPNLLSGGWELVRRHLGAVFVGGFGVAPPSPPVFGLLHPDPLCAFPADAVPHVVFGKMSPWPLTDVLGVQWSDEVKESPTPTPRARILTPADAGFGDFDPLRLRND